MITIYPRMRVGRDMMQGAIMLVYSTLCRVYYETNCTLSLLSFRWESAPRTTSCVCSLNTGAKEINA